MTHGPPLDRSLSAEIERLVVDAALDALGDHVEAVVSKGSAVNGDFIPYYSDFDVHIYVDQSVMHGPRSLKPEHTLRFQPLVGSIDPEAFQVSQVQIIFVSTDVAIPDWLPPVPGTYRVAYGEFPGTLHILDEAEFARQARAGLNQMDRLTSWFLERIVDKPDAGLAPIVRLMGTFLKPALRQAATVLGAPPIDVWTWSQARVLGLVEPEVVPDKSASSYFAKARDWQVARLDPSRLRAMIMDALSAYEAIAGFSERLD